MCIVLLTGEQYDPNAGFYYLRARYYNPGVGRFVTVDPFEGFQYYPATLHDYLYCLNNSINYIDPSGEFGLLAASLTSLSVMSVLVATTYHYVPKIKGTDTGIYQSLVIGYYGSKLIKDTIILMASQRGRKNVRRDDITYALDEAVKLAKQLGTNPDKCQLLRDILDARDDLTKMDKKQILKAYNCARHRQ